MAEMIKEYSIESYERVYNAFAQEIVTMFNADDELHPQIFFVSLDPEKDDNIGKYVQLDPEIVARMHTPDGQEAMWELLTECVTVGTEAHHIVTSQFDIQPDLVLHVAPCRIMSEEDEEEMLSSYSEDNNEALLVSVHTPLAMFLGSCPINEDNGAAEFGPMDKQPCSFLLPSIERGISVPPSIH